MKGQREWIRKFVNIILFPNKKQRIITSFVIGVFVPLVYLLVYFTGGIKFVYSHTMYIPILLAGVLFGLKGGIFVGIVGGLLLGPFMPIDVTTGEPQQLLNWLYRLLVFFMIGSLSGFFSDRLRKSQKEMVRILSRHQQSGIFLFNAISKEQAEKKILTDVFIIRVLNFQSIVDYLGSKVYFSLWQGVEEALNKKYPNGKLYQVENIMFAYIVEYPDIDINEKALIEIFQNSHFSNGVPIYLDVVIGHARGINDLYDLVKNAATASRYAELNYKSFKSYENEQQLSRISFSLVAEMRTAIKNKDLILNYQPIYTCDKNNIIGAESLVRWQHPVHGLLGPMMFIPMLEETQLINDMTRYICQCIKEDIIDDIVKKDIFITVNISPKNILNIELIKELTGSTFFTQKQREHIVFEITESILMEQPKKAMESLMMIKNSGIRLALDDFGTGYSSLSYMGKYPLDFVKIDKSFIDLYAEKSIQEIVHTVIDLSHNLNYRVIAEGIETEYLSKKLLDAECDFLQGYYFSKPVPLDVFKLKLAK